MSSISFIIQSRSKSAPIYAVLSAGRGKVFKRKSGFKIDYKDWKVEPISERDKHRRKNSKTKRDLKLGRKGFPISNTTENKALAYNLKEMRLAIERKLLKSETFNFDLTAEWLQFQIDLFHDKVDESGKRSGLLDAVQWIIDNSGAINEGLSDSRVKTYKALYRLLNEFQETRFSHGETREFRVKDVDFEFYTAFVAYLMNEKKYAKSYAHKMGSDTKTVCLYAKKRGIETSLGLELITSQKIERSLPIYLSTKELEQIRKANILAPHLQNARKWILFGCAIGQRGGDLLNITEANFLEFAGNTFITLKQQKTKKEVVIPVLNETRRIIKDGLPYSISLQKLNDYIKDVCRIAGIDEPIEGKKRDPEVNRYVNGIFPKWELISSHTFRRSFCTNNYGKIPTPLIMAVTKHASEEMLLRYIGLSGMDKAQDFIAHARKNQGDIEFEIVKRDNRQSS